MITKLDDPQYKSFTRVLLVSCAICVGKKIFQLKGTLTYSFQFNSMIDALESLLIIFQISDKWLSVTKGLLTSSVFFGAFVGAIVSSYLLKYSQRRAIIIIDILLIGGSVLQTSSNIYVFMIGRIVGGIGSGAHSVVIPVYLKQISPKELYGMIGGLYQLTYAIGYMLTEAFGLILENTKENPKIEDINFTNLKIYFLAPCIFSLIRIVLFITFVRNESPQYYIDQDDVTKAKQIINQVYKAEYVQSILDNLYQQKEKKDKKIDIYSDALKIRLRLALFMNSLAVLCGAGTVMQYSTTIFRATSSEETAFILTLFVSILKVISFSTSAMVTQKVGRRPPFLIGNGVMCVTLMGIGASSLVVEKMSLPTDTLQYYRYLIILLIFMYLLAAFNSINFLGTVYIPEIVPAQGVAIAFQLYWFFYIVTLFGFPVVTELVGISACFFFFGSCTLSGHLVLYKYALETANKNETEIDEMFDRLRYPKTRKLTQIQDYSMFTENTNDT